MQHHSKSHHSLEKALNILLAFEPQNKGMGAAELGEILEIHKSTVSRLLKVLTSYHFLNQDLETKKYSLGSSIIRLSRALQQSLKTNMVQIAKPYIDDLGFRLKETVILEVLAGENMVMVYIAEGPRLVRLAGSIGDRVPFHAAAGAKAFVAFCPSELQKTLLGSTLRRYTKNTITDWKTLETQFKEIRKKGFAFDQEELDEGTFAIGTPIFNHENNPVAALVVAGPSQRISWDDNSPIVLDLKETGQKISEKLFLGAAV